MYTKAKYRSKKCFEHLLEGKEGYLFKFGLKNRYHHLDIFVPHHKFIGFSWVIKGNMSFLFSQFYYLS